MYLIFSNLTIRQLVKVKQQPLYTTVSFYYIYEMSKKERKKNKHLEMFNLKNHA